MTLLSAAARPHVNVHVGVGQTPQLGVGLTNEMSNDGLVVDDTPFPERQDDLDLLAKWIVTVSIEELRKWALRQVSLTRGWRIENRTSIAIIPFPRPTDETGA